MTDIGTDPVKEIALLFKYSCYPSPVGKIPGATVKNLLVIVSSSSELSSSTVDISTGSTEEDIF